MGRVGGAPFEHDVRVEISETPELQRVVGRLEDDDERSLVDERNAGEDTRQWVDD